MLIGGVISGVGCGRGWLLQCLTPRPRSPSEPSGWVAPNLMAGQALAALGSVVTGRVRLSPPKRKSVKSLAVF